MAKQQTEEEKEFSKKHWKLIELVREVQQIAIFSRVSARHTETESKEFASWILYVSGETGEIQVSEHNGYAGENEPVFSTFNISTLLQFENHVLPLFVLDFSLRALGNVVKQYQQHANTLAKMLEKY